MTAMHSDRNCQRCAASSGVIMMCQQRCSKHFWQHQPAPQSSKWAALDITFYSVTALQASLQGLEKTSLTG